jgi:type 1 fimbria pilin
MRKYSVLQGESMQMTFLALPARWWGLKGYAAKAVNLRVIPIRILWVYLSLLQPVQAASTDIKPLIVTANILGGVPCTIDVSKVNPLDLGEMVTTQVNGISGKMLIPYEVKCTTPTNLKMTILTSSAATWYGNGTLATVGLNNQNLGIQLLKEGGAAVVFNDAMPFNSSTPPKLYAVPVKRTGSSLSAAVFYSASATMRVEFP